MDPFAAKPRFQRPPIAFPRQWHNRAPRRGLGGCTNLLHKILWYLTRSCAFDVDGERTRRGGPPADPRNTSPSSALVRPPRGPQGARGDFNKTLSGRHRSLAALQEQRPLAGDAAHSMAAEKASGEGRYSRLRGLC
jgi:hypothetical protein